MTTSTIGWKAKVKSVISDVLNAADCSVRSSEADNLLDGRFDDFGGLVRGPAAIAEGQKQLASAALRYAGEAGLTVLAVGDDDVRKVVEREIGEAHLPIGEEAFGDGFVDDFSYGSVARVLSDFLEQSINGVIGSFELLIKAAALVKKNAGDIEALVIEAGLIQQGFQLAGAEVTRGRAYVDDVDER